MKTSCDTVVGRYAQSYIPANGPISESDLFPGHGGLPSQLGHNQRAIALKLSPEALVDNAIQPGDRVDVIVTAAKEGRNFSRTVCQDLSVLLSVPKEGILPSTSHNQTSSGRITLVATPDQVEKLSEAQSVGKLCLVLRNPDDHGIVALAGSDERDILPASAFAKVLPAVKQMLSLQPPPPLSAVQPLPPAPAPTKLGWLIELYKGATKNELVFGNDGKPGETIIPGGTQEIGMNDRGSSQQVQPQPQPTMAGDSVARQQNVFGRLSW